MTDTVSATDLQSGETQSAPAIRSFARITRGATVRQPRPGKWELLALAAIVLVGAALRIYLLGDKSLWLDELNLLRSSYASGKWLAPFGLSILDHPPGYMIILRIMMHVDQSEWWLRLPAMITSVIALPVMWGLARTLFGPLAGIFAAFILALSPMHLRYAQEAHSYGLYGLLSIVVIWLLYRAARAEAVPEPAGRTVRGWLGIWLPFILTSIVLMYVHYYSLFLIALCVLLFPLFLLDSGGGRLSSLWRDRSRRVAIGRMVAAMAAIGVLYLPQLLIGVGNSLDYAKNLDESLPQHSLLDSALWAARPITENWDLGYRFGVIAVIAVTLAGLAWLLWRRAPLGVSMIMVLVLPVPPSIFMAFRTGIAYNVRRIIFTLPVLILVMAVGMVVIVELLSLLASGTSNDDDPVRGVGHRRVAMITSAAMLLLFTFAAVAPIQGYYARPKQDWKTVGEILNTLVDTHDVAVARPKAAKNLSWYYPAIQPVDGELESALELACGLKGQTYLVVMPNEPLTASEQRWIDSHFVEIPVKDLVVYYRTCEEDSPWYGAGAEPAFDIAWNPHTPFPPTRRAYEAYAQVGSQGDGAVQVLQPTPTPAPTVVIPTDQGPWVEAAALLRAGRNDEALAKYQELVDTHPNHRGSMMGLAQALGAVGRTDEAVALFDQVSEQWPDFVWSYVRRAELLESVGKEQEALKDFRAAAALANEDADVSFVLGHAFMRLGENREAIEQFEAVLAIDPDREGVSAVLEKLRQ
ncbi:MAG: tetratricopeptide repeat protein [Anaerolineae bacterium]|nr:tetratricopeptide repeat protein [Anaerolineae bacterium]